MKANILERTDSDIDAADELDEGEYDDSDDDEDIWDDDDIGDDEYEDAAEVEMPADQLAEETPQGVCVQAAYGEGVFPENTRMELTDIPKEEAMQAVSEVLDDVVDAVAVDITFLDENGEELEPEEGGEVAVSLSLDAPLQEGKQTVFHIDDEGNVEEVTGVNLVSATETGAEFVADAFSAYVVVTKSSGTVSYQTLEDGSFIYEMLGDSKLSLHTMPNTKEVKVPSLIQDENNVSYTVTEVLGEYGTSNSRKGVGGRGSQEKIILADTITKIGTNAFSEIQDTNGQATLTSVALPKKLQEIGEKAFSGNQKLATVVIPDTVTTIKAEAFEDCGLTSIFIPKSVTKIENHAFGWNSTKKKVEENFTIYGYAGSQAEAYAKKDDITFVSVGSAADSSSSKDSSASTSGTTKSSSSSSSDDDDEDKDKDDDDDDDDKDSSSSSFSTGDTKTYSSKSGLNKAEYEKTGSSTVTYNEAKISTSSKKARVAGTVKISSKTYKVTEVAENAFSGYKNLKKVKIGKNVEALDENMIADCPNLTKLVINSKKLTANKVKNSLKGSNVKKIVVPSDMVKAYEKIFTKAITGSKTDLVIKAHPVAKKSASSSAKTTNSSAKSSRSSTSGTTKTTGSATSSNTGTKTTSGVSSSSTGTKKTTSSTNSTAKKTTNETTGKTTSK